MSRTVLLFVAAGAVCGCEPMAPPAPPDLTAATRFGDGRLRHAAPVTSLALSPDGKTLAVATSGVGPVVHLWDVATARPVKVLRVDGPASPPAFTSPASPHLATAVPHRATVVGFAGDGRRLVVVRHMRLPDGTERHHQPATIDTATGAVTVWDVMSETEYRLPGFTIAPAGNVAAEVDYHGGVRLWDVATGRKVRDVGRVRERFIDCFRAVCFSPDGRRLAVCCGSQTAHIADVAGGPLRAVAVPGPATDVFMLAWPRADRLVAVRYNALVAVDPATGRELARVDVTGNIAASTRAVAGTTLVARPNEREPWVAFDLDTLAVIGGRAFPGGGRDTPTALAANGKVLAVAVGHAVRLYDAASGASLHPDRDRYPADPADRLELSADGRRLVSASGTREYTWDMPAGVLRAAPDEAGSPTGGFLGRAPLPASADFPGTVFAVVSPDGRRVAASGGVALAVRRTDPGAEWVELESYRGRPGPTCGRSPPNCAKPIRFSPDGRRLLTWDDGYVLWDVAAKPVRVGRLSTGSAGEWARPEAAFSPDGRRVAAAVRAADGASAVHVWEAASAAELGRLAVPGGATACAFTSDGRRLVVARPDTTFGVHDYAAWEATTGRTLGDPWDRLADPDPRTGLATVRALAADPDAARRLADAFTPRDADRLDALVRDLGDADFRKREAATAALAAAGESAEGPLRAAVASDPSPEVRTRAGHLLRRFDPAEGRPAPGHLRAVRAVEVLERAGTPAARTVLDRWADGGASVRAAEAKSARDRMAAVPAARP